MVFEASQRSDSFGIDQHTITEIHDTRRNTVIDWVDVIQPK
jgi:hypothetical protein